MKGFFARLTLTPEPEIQVLRSETRTAERVRFGSSKTLASDDWSELSLSKNKIQNRILNVKTPDAYKSKFILLIRLSV